MSTKTLNPGDLFLNICIEELLQNQALWNALSYHVNEKFMDLIEVVLPRLREPILKNFEFLRKEGYLPSKEKLGGLLGHLPDTELYYIIKNPLSSKKVTLKDLCNAICETLLSESNIALKEGDSSFKQKKKYASEGFFLAELGGYKPIEKTELLRLKLLSGGDDHELINLLYQKIYPCLEKGTTIIFEKIGEFYLSQARKELIQSFYFLQRNVKGKKKHEFVTPGFRRLIKYRKLPFFVSKTKAKVFSFPNENGQRKLISALQKLQKRIRIKKKVVSLEDYKQIKAKRKKSERECLTESGGKR